MTVHAFPMSQDQRDALTRQKRRRTIMHTMAALAGDHPGTRLARKLLAENARIETDVDVARRTLQRAGFYPVYNATVTGGSPNQWIVGSKVMTTAEMLALAGES